MAEVFKARVTGASGFQREVVLKRLHASHNDDPELVSMFKDEARILGVLHHPNVVQALDFGESDGQLYLVLEYLEGPSLGRVLRGERPVSPAVVAYLGREIARALDYVHNVENTDGTPLRLVHRDVTPSNVIVTPSGTVKLLDFGIAKFATAIHATGVGTGKGKPGYLAPEQLQGKGDEIDGRVDLFALGVVLHELLTGDRLFRGDNDLGTMKKIMEMKIPRPSTKVAGVPPALDRIVMRALERDPGKRTASAAEVARDLDDVVLAAGLRQEDIAAFVRDVEAGSFFAPSPDARAAARIPSTETTRRAIPPLDSTRRDLLLPLRWWMGGLSVGRRTALIAGLSLLLGTAGAVGWGVTSLSTAAPRSPVGVVPGRHLPKPAPGPQRTIAQAFSAEP
jgi:serine/threonine protein kinase